MINLNRFWLIHFIVIWLLLKDVSLIILSLSNIKTLLALLLQLITIPCFNKELSLSCRWMMLPILILTAKKLFVVLLEFFKQKCPKLINDGFRVIKAFNYSFHLVFTVSVGCWLVLLNTWSFIFLSLWLRQRRLPFLDRKNFVNDFFIGAVTHRLS